MCYHKNGAKLFISDQRTTPNCNVAKHMRKPFILFLLGMVSCSSEKGFIEYNTPPQTTILGPIDGAQFEEGEVIRFTGLVDDNESLANLLVQWTSSIDEVLPDYDPPDAEGNVEFATASLTEGVHIITLRAIDTDAYQGEDDISIEVMKVPEKPSIEILHPTEEELGLDGSAFAFIAQVSDRQDPAEDLTVELSSNPGGFVCYMQIDGAGNAQCQGSLELGQYVLTFTVEDTDGNISYAMTSFQVVDLLDYDSDGDGYSPNGGDCNDSNDTIYPGAPEICDGLDNDCNELTEIDVNSPCYDDDGDGYCEVPPCVNAEGTLADCDDSNELIAPNATEIVNGLDDNCNGFCDDNTNVYDDDGDGYCETPPCIDDVNCDGTVDINVNNNLSDCNDSNYAIYPAATEVCDDGIDNNCDGNQNEQNAIGCSLFYYDGDGDTYGISGQTECWCEDGQYPYTGLDASDCYDNNPDANPDQTAFFNAHRGDGSFDYDCSNSEEKQDYSISGGCSWQFINNFQCDQNNAGWEYYVPNCGDSALYIGDCDGSYDVVCYGLCLAFNSDPWSCLFQCSNSCNPDYTSMAQGCR